LGELLRIFDDYKRTRFAVKLNDIGMMNINEITMICGGIKLYAWGRRVFNIQILIDYYAHYAE
jgi:hypothetical protein